MELVPGWLKLLRLHKYTDLIMSFTYEAMLHLTEEQLEVKGVTKGARRKIINNIQVLSISVKTKICCFKSRNETFNKMPFICLETVG